MNWYKTEKGTYKYYEGQLNEKEMRHHHYIKDMGYSYLDEKNGIYYSLFGLALKYDSYGIITKRIDDLIIKTERYNSLSSISVSSFDTESVPPPSVDFRIPGMAPGDYPLIYQGKSFCNTKEGSYLHINKDLKSYRGMELNGTEYTRILYYPDQQRIIRGVKQNEKTYDASFDGFFLIGEPRSTANYFNFQIRFDEENATAFWNAYNHLFGTNRIIR